ncbi:MAG: hypothetical protein KA886_01760 [Candidatus Cloacimonetes bacterium]|nr:hypothetical protein [Candidatus Cloacimonadota bacterium]
MGAIVQIINPTCRFRLVNRIKENQNRKAISPKEKVGGRYFTTTHSTSKLLYLRMSLTDFLIKRLKAFINPAQGVALG